MCALLGSQVSRDSSRSRLARSSGDLNDRSSAVEREVQGGQHRPLQVHVEDALGVLGGPPGQLGDAPGARQGRLDDLVVRAHVVDEPDLGRPRRRDPVAGQRVLLGQLQAGEQGPRHRPAVGGHQAHEHVGVGEVGALGHEHDVGQRAQAAAEPDRGAVDRGHDRDPARHHAGHDLAAVGEGHAAERLVGGQLVDVAEVAARRERPAVAGQDRHPGVVVGVELREQAAARGARGSWR